MRPEAEQKLHELEPDIDKKQALDIQQYDYLENPDTDYIVQATNILAEKIEAVQRVKPQKGAKSKSLQEFMPLNVAYDTDDPAYLSNLILFQLQMCTQVLEKTKIAQKNKKNSFDFGLVEQILNEAKTLAEQFKTLEDGLWLAD